MTRRGIACVAAFAAVMSVGALGYAVLWAFDFSEPTRPAAQPPDGKQEAKRPVPRRKAVVVIAPRVPGEDVSEIASAAQHAAPRGETAAVVPIPTPDEASPLVAVTPPPTPATPGEDGRAVASAPQHAAPRGETATVMRMPTPDEASPLVAVAPPPTPATPGEDAPSIAAWSRLSVGSAAADRPISVDTPGRSELVPQNEAKAPRIDTPTSPDPEPTGTIGPPTVFRTKPRATQRPREDALTPPGVVIIRGVPPVPGDSPGIVRPGPLIIHVPTPARR
jgi:hypothetical protein